MACINRHRCNTCSYPCKAEDQEEEFAKWWASLTILQKESVCDQPYPSCTRVWNSLKRDERMQRIEKSGLFRVKGNKLPALGHDF